MQQTPSKRIAAPESEQEARDRLETLAQHLSEIPCASAEIRFALQAVSDFLTGKSQSLDHAFGIRRARGKPKQPPGNHMPLMLNIWPMREAGLTWPQILDKLGYLNPENLNDPDYLAKLYARYRPHIVRSIAAELTAGISKQDDCVSPRARASQKAAKKMVAEIKAAKPKQADIKSGE